MTSNERRVRVEWAGREKVFEGWWNDKGPVLLDSGSKEGPSPTEALLMSLATCMAVDIQVILEKGRVPVEEIVIEVKGERAPEPPRRFMSLNLDVRVKGPAEGDENKIERAVQLSRDTYCSVFHTLRPDMVVEISVARM